ncbi:MAG: PKD domain-containing protein [Flavobacteriales bacterium]|nr:PKD domain-containing protein [Flavobacteriales bacterium]
MLDNITPIFAQEPNIFITSHLDGDNENCAFNIAGTVTHAITDSVVLTGNFAESPLTANLNNLNWDGTLTFNGGGNQTVTATAFYIDPVTQSSSCVYAAVDLIVNSPTASFSFNNTCQDETVAFTDASTPYGTTTLTSWNWDFGDGNTSTTPSPTHTYTTPGTKNVSLSIVSSDGCVATLTQTIDIYALPVTSFSANDTCLGDLTSFTNQTTISIGTIAAWAWDFGDGNTSTNQDDVHTYSADGVYQVSLTATSDNNCIISTTQQIEVFAEPLAAYSFTDDCLYEAVNFIDNSSINTGQIINWDWDFGDGNTSTDTSPNYTYTTDGTYTVTQIITSAHGCDDTLSQTITRFPVPAPSFTANPECLYTPITFVNTSTINAPDNISGWIWNFGDGSVLSSEQAPTHVYPSEGDYHVTLIASSNNGCVATFDDTITVHPVPVASFSATEVCENEPPTQFTNESTITSGSILTTTWDFGDGNLSSLPNPVNYYSQAGIYTTQLIVISNFGCEDTIENPITVLEKPTVEFSSDLLEGCSPLCINLNDLSTTNNSSMIAWDWNFGNNTTSNTSTPQVCFENNSNENDTTFNIELTVTNDLGCSETLLKENFITVFHNPIASFEASPPSTNMYLSNIEFNNNSIGADNYEWDFGDHETSNLFELSHTYQDTGKYTVTLIASTINNCIDTSELVIAIDAVTSIYVPNAFTPNGDGDNDIFNVVGYNLQQAELSIFDKWGTLIYFTDDLTRGWDGEHKTVPAKTDTYIWKLTVIDGFGATHHYKGHVILLR